jgi:hypothetical protein
MITALIEPILAIIIIATFVFAASSIYGKFLIKEVQSSYHFLLLQIIFSFVLVCLVNIMLFLSGYYPAIDLQISGVVLIFLASIFAFIGFVTLLRGFEIGDVSVGGVFLSSRVFISVPIAIIFIGEKYPFITYICIVITIVGALMVSWQKNLPIKEVLTFRASGSNYFLITLISWGVANSIVRQLNNEVFLLLFLLIRGVFFVTFAVVTYPILNRFLASGKAIKYTSTSIKHTGIYILILFFAQASFVYALGVSLTLTEGIGVLEGVFTFLLAVIISKNLKWKEILEEPLDQLTLSIRSIGVILAIIGTVGVLISYTQ